MNRAGAVALITRTAVRFRGGYRLSSLLIDRLVPSRGVVRARAFGFDLSLRLGDNVTRTLLFYPTLYEPSEIAFMRDEIGPDDVVVDAGAHFGLYSLLASELATKVIAVEANPATFAILSENLSRNALRGNVHAVSIGLSDRRETLRLLLKQDDPSAASFLAADSEPRSEFVEVPCAPLDEVLAELGESRCDVLKIDVEGFEYKVLKPFLESGRRPRVILLEYYARHNTGDTCELLESHGYSEVGHWGANSAFRHGNG